MTPRMTVRAAFGLAVVTVLTAGCGSETEPAGAEDDVTATAPATESATPQPAEFEDVPWETLQTYLAAPRGRYTKVHGLNESGSQTTIVQETTRFDLDAGYVERTMKIPAAILPPDMAAEAPNGLDFSFIQTASAFLMSHANMPETCDAKWVDMTENGLPAIPGLSKGEQALIIEPLDALRRAVGEPVHLETTAEGSSYEITLPADAGLTISAQQRTDPAVVDTLAGLQTTARVLLPADGGPLEVGIDFSQVMSALAGQPFPKGTVIRTDWTVSTDLRPFDTSLPTDLADPSCLVGPTEG
ncbi:hypothetical protein E1212_19235 [Jiangella ureilytica]|uniref:LppX_LprAFG lipoprotein n=1 Tax=Jiangella ureilytica TaxID=2530374 RepID=A0A4R4RHX8_9ACTN|nr:hypothetical protein [Jiangella ureilytica]TDC49108.1 hypothetical protein E1212_19235 [Jiangella ureilytica]